MLLSAARHSGQPAVKTVRRRRFRPAARPLPLTVTTLTLLTAGLFLCSLLTGSGDSSTERAMAYLLGEASVRQDSQLALVIQTLRIPRAFAAVIVGCALGAAGALLQAATRNPLAETGLLGVNSGAALAVVAGITFVGLDSSLSYLFWAFGGALVASGLVLLVGRLDPNMTPLRLILAGAALGATFKGLTSALLLQGTDSYDQYRFWVIGSLSGVTRETTHLTVFPVALGLALASVIVRPLSALQLGDEPARALGHRPALIRMVTAVAVTLLAGASTAIAGPIAFLGLLAPHAARLITGPRLAAQLLLSALIGAAAMLGADVLARLIVRPYEAPVAVVLAVIGGPVLALLARSRNLLTMRTPD